jgi:hypothetical protein
VKLVLTDLAWFCNTMNAIFTEPSHTIHMVENLGTTPVWELGRFKEGLHEYIQNDRVTDFEFQLSNNQ